MATKKLFNKLGIIYCKYYISNQMLMQSSNKFIHLYNIHVSVKDFNLSSL